MKEFPLSPLLNKLSSYAKRAYYADPEELSRISLVVIALIVFFFLLSGITGIKIFPGLWNFNHNDGIMWILFIFFILFNFNYVRSIIHDIIEERITQQVTDEYKATILKKIPEDADFLIKFDQALTNAQKNQFGPSPENVEDDQP